MSNDDISNEVNEMLRELAGRAAKSVQPDEITVKMLMDKHGIEYQRATNILKDAEANGELTSRIAYDPASGHTVKAYRKAE